MRFDPTSIPGVHLVVGAPREDSRGRFERLFCNAEMSAIRVGFEIVQINHSLTRRAGALRGLHYQHPPHAEAKLVRCLRGHVFDVAVDLRADSPTFLHWHAQELRAGDSRALYIPEGVAHGFQALADDSELLYLHTAAFDAASEGAVRYDDPRIGIDWPLPVTDLSERDRAHPWLDAAFKGVRT